MAQAQPQLQLLQDYHLQEAITWSGQTTYIKCQKCLRNQTQHVQFQVCQLYMQMVTQVLITIVMME